ncbi:hypothetical protein [Sinorhizobium medicae]|uniref:hypothetical protein n=1 Tax=Sinorhizobium medicae TaxID=110321 RepID=UPI001295478A|nr:hypothetical protein [Sinorhizobium medicae]MDX0530757.1 hypothetical protein [Sinorhizobium medicae]MDX0948963.1 hypothetical protein [Sinorhizobium medicae]MQV48297.1 hypothetical protein [Sinorhizobium medicae]MQV53909.1 hypothetical protein [Sinorhizobium medicae]MQV71554.1 hypothetical protein [Sinorhizobium medicae]
MEEIEVAGTVILPIGANVMQVDYVIWQNRAWLAPVYLEAPNGQRRPLRLIAPRFAPGFVPPAGADVLNIFQRMPLSMATLEQGFIPDDMMPILHIVENPNVFVRSAN